MDITHPAQGAAQRAGHSNRKKGPGYLGALFMDKSIASTCRARAKQILGSLLLGVSAIALVACHRNADAQSSRPAMVTSSSSNEVALSPSQAKVIRIETVRVRQFLISKDLTGSISYTDDPALSQAESTLLGAAATYNLTRKELQRVRALGRNNGIAEKEMEQAISDAQTADGALKVARDALRVLGKSDTQIDHIVATGRTESPSVRPAVKWAIGNVAESDTPFFHRGQPVRLNVAAYPGRWFRGTVAEVYSSVDPNYHRVTLRARIDDPKNELRLGMLADIVVEADKPITAIGIPAAGVVREGDGTMTSWTTSDGYHFAQRIVTTGLRSNGNIQIIKGLKAGDQVVSDGAIFLDNMLQAIPSD